MLLGMWIASQGGFRPRAASVMLVAVYQVLDSLPVLALWWLAAAGYGYPLRRWFFSASCDGVVLQLIAGMAALLMLSWLSAWLIGLSAAAAWTICAVGLALLAVQLALWHRRHPGHTLALPTLPWTLALAGPAVGLLLVAAACPPGAASRAR
jgi:hypothetical protein